MDWKWPRPRRTLSTVECRVEYSIRRRHRQQNLQILLSMGGDHITASSNLELPSVNETIATVADLPCAGGLDLRLEHSAAISESCELCDGTSTSIGTSAACRPLECMLELLATLS